MPDMRPTLSLITNIFKGPRERTRAIGVYVFACSGVEINSARRREHPKDANVG